MLVGMVMRAQAMVRTNSKGSSGATSPMGVPGTFTRWLIGTDSGGGVMLANWAISEARSRRFSPMPTMPPQQTLMPAWRTLARVSKRSAWLWVVITWP